MNALVVVLVVAFVVAPLVALLSPPVVANAAEPSDRIPLILISLDGFSPTYLKLGVTPHLNALSAKGAHALAMQAVFPSVTFPNHTTLVTGRYPDQHGVVGNTMEDSAMPGLRFRLADRLSQEDRRWWDQAEPVWVSAERQGLRTGALFWPGSAIDIGGLRPTHWRSYEEKISALERVDIVLRWLDTPPPERPAFLALYLSNVDTAGHEFGPNSPQTKLAVARVDAAVGRLMAGLATRGVAANIVVVSDHGMAATDPAHIIALNEVLPPFSYRLVLGGSYAGLEALAGQTPALESQLLKDHPHMQCWRKAEIPTRFHFGKHPRVPAYICLAEVGWTIMLSHDPNKTPKPGAHGYDPAAPEMQALFLAAGPAFKSGSVTGTLTAVDVYSLLMRLLALPALPSEGSIQPFLPILH